MCDSNGKLLTNFIYDDIWLSCNQIIRHKYIRVKKDSKFGLISFTGKEILPPIYDFIDDCENNIAIVNHGEKLIDITNLSTLYETKGNEQIKRITNGWMKVTKIEFNPHYIEKSIGLLDSSGKFYEFYDKRNIHKKPYYAEKEMYDIIGCSFHDELLPVYDQKRGYGYVDIDSNEIIECKYCEISDFKNGRAKVRLDCDYGYINTNGCIIVKKNNIEIEIPHEYDWGYDFNDGYFIVQKGKLFGALDEHFNEIIPCLLESKEEVILTYSKVKCHCYLAEKKSYIEGYMNLLPPIRFEENSLFGYKSHIGKVIFPPVLKVREFVEGMAIINIGGKFGYINQCLQLIIKPIYDYASNFSEGLALVHEIGKGNMFINKNGEPVIKCDYHLECIEPFYDGVANCEYNRCQPGRDNEPYSISKYYIGFEV